eukprot:265460-Rhodomonas_salina.1
MATERGDDEDERSFIFVAPRQLVEARVTRVHVPRIKGHGQLATEAGKCVAWIMMSQAGGVGKDPHAVRLQLGHASPAGRGRNEGGNERMSGGDGESERREGAQKREQWGGRRMARRRREGVGSSGVGGGSEREGKCSGKRCGSGGRGGGGGG